MLDGLADFDGGYTAIDFELVWRRTVEDVLTTETWQWVLARCYRLIDLPDTLTRKEALNRGV